MAKSNPRDLAYPWEEPTFPKRILRDFEHNGDRAGHRNQLDDMVGLEGKELQESYRSGLKQSKRYTEKVSDH